MNPWEKYQPQPTETGPWAKYQAAQQLNTSPFTVPPAPQQIDLPPGSGVGTMGMAPPDVSDPYSGEQRAAAAKGVDVNTGGGIDRTLLGFAPNEAFKQSFAKDLLTKKYGSDVQVRMGPESKDVEFLNPKSHRWTTLDEAGFSPADLKDMFGPGSVVAGSALGGGIGTLGGVPGIAAGTGVGTALSDYARLAYGRSKGVHNLSDKEMFTEAAKAGGVDALMAFGTEKAVKVGQLFKRFFSPQRLKPDEAKAILEQLDEAWPQVQALKEGGAEGLQPNIPNVIGNEKLAGELNSATQNIRLSRNEMAAMDEKNAAALDKYFTTQFQPADQAAQTRIGAEVQQGTRGSLDQKAAASQADLESQMARMKQTTSNLPVYDEGALGASARGIVAEARSKLSAAEKDAWNAYDSAIGFNKETHSSQYQIPLSQDAVTTVNALLAQKAGALLPFQKAHLSQVLGEKIVLQAEGPKLVDSAILSKSGEPFQKTVEPRPLNLADVDTSIKELRERIRAARNGTLQSDISTAKMEQISGALASARAEFLKKTDPQALAALEQAEAASVLKHNTIDRSSLGFMLRKQGDNYVMYSDEVFRKIFLANDVNAARELMSLADEPGKKLAIQNSLWAIYRQDFMENGIPRPTLHEKFLDKYGEMAKAIFGPDYKSMVAPFGKMGEAITNAAEQSASYMKFLRTGLSKRIDNANPDNLIGEVLFSKKTSLADVGKLAGEMKRVGNYQAGREALGGYISKSVRNADGVLDPSRLSAFVQKNASAIDGFAEPGYSKNLLSLARGLKMAAPLRAGAKKEFDDTLYQGLRKAIIPVLSREGRVLTWMRGGLDKRGDRVLFEIMTDPVKLREYVRLGDRRMTDRKVAAFLAGVGGASLASEAP